MKTWIVEHQTNHNLSAHIVNADTEQEAIKLAKNCEMFGTWDGWVAYEIDTETKGVIGILVM